MTTIPATAVAQAFAGEGEARSSSRDVRDDN